MSLVTLTNSDTVDETVPALNAIVSLLKSGTNGQILYQGVSGDPTFVTTFIETAIPITNWDMDADSSKAIINPSIDVTKIRLMSAVIFNDAGTEAFPLDVFFAGTIAGAVAGVNSSLFLLNRTSGGLFDSTSYNDTSVTRGYIYVRYSL